MTQTQAAGPVISDGQRIDVRGGVPRTLGLAMVRNEQDIIEPFIRHALTYLDHLVVIDHASTDRTHAIIVALAAETGRVVFGLTDEPGYFQSTRMSRMLRACQPIFRADYVFLLDADEFLHAPDRATFLAELATVPPRGYGSIAWRTHVLVADEIESGSADPPVTMPWVRDVELNPMTKAVLRLDGQSDSDLRITMGNHFVYREGQEPLAERRLDRLRLDHFPIRSRDHAIAKSVISWVSTVAQNPDARRNPVVDHWLDNFDRIAADATLSDAALLFMSQHYMQYQQAAAAKDAVPVRGAALPDHGRKYSDGTFCPPLALIARSWERSLAAKSQPAALTPPDKVDTHDETVGSRVCSADWLWRHVFVDVAPWRFLAETHGSASLLEIGCGVGELPATLATEGFARTMGVDCYRTEMTALSAAQHRCCDPLSGFRLGERFDIVVCQELAHHAEGVALTVLFETIERHARGLIVFSAATQGQIGASGCNAQPIGHWLERWRMRGWLPSLTDTLGFRALSTLPWLRRNTLVLRRQAAGGAAATDFLLELARAPAEWPATEPGIRRGAFGTWL